MNNLNSPNEDGVSENQNRLGGSGDVNSVQSGKSVPGGAAWLEQNYQNVYEDSDGEGYNGAAQTGDQQNLLRGVLSALQKHWFLILGINLFVTAATLIYVAQKPNFYKATARVQINEETNPADNSQSGSGSVIVNNPTYDPVYFTTQLQILEGAGLLRRVAKTLDLEHNQTFLDPQQGRRLTAWQNIQKMFSWYRPPAAPPPITNQTAADNLKIKSETPSDAEAETEKYSPMVGRIKKNLTVLPVRDSRMGSRETRLIEIEYTHEDPQVAAKIINAIGDAYVLQNLEQKVQMNASAGDFLQKRVADLQSEIRLGEERLINYSKANQVMPLDNEQNTVVQRFADLNLKLGQAENDRLAAQTVYEATVRNQMRTATAERGDTQVVGLEARLNELRQRLAQLKTEYTDQWYEVVETRKQIETIENQLLSIRKRASDIQLAGLGERLSEAVAREKELRKSFDAQRGEVIRQNEASINFRIIQQEIATNKTLLNGLLQRSRENDVILNGTPNNVLVAERALVPDSPVGPERGKTIMLAFLLSLLAGGGIAFLLEWLNDSVHYSEDIEANLGMPLLGVIPSAPARLGERLLPSSRALTRRRKKVEVADLEVFERPEFAEAYLQLRTNLMLSTAGGAPRTILITSGEEGEGKTMTAVNLAHSLAKTGEPILLIDADLRCPRVHLFKGLSNQYGLSTLLTVKTPDVPLIEKVIQKNGCGNLHVLTAGERSVAPANLLCSEQMRLLLETLSARYTHIIIDSPPVLYFADSAILSTLVNAVIIVVRDNASSRQMILKAKKMLHNVGANVVGMVVNGIALRRSHYNRYKYYESEAEASTHDTYQFIKL